MGYNIETTFGTSHDVPYLFEERILESIAVPGTLFAFGINYKTAPVEIREKLYLHEKEIDILLSKVKGRLSECFVISTCNRTEIYGVSQTPDVDIEFFKELLIDIKDARGILRDEHFFALISCAACLQIFNVATSIDSKVIGDSQILRQLRSAYARATEHGYTGKILNQLLQRAFRLGKTTYTETSIHDGAVSVSLAAVELAIQTFGSIRGRTALVIGAGETARLTAEALVNKRIGKVIVTNRTREHAEALVDVLDGDYSFETQVIDSDRFRTCLPEVDIVISSTGSDDPVLYGRDFRGVENKVLAIDIAVPRDIDPSVGEVPNVILHNIDDLHSIIDEAQEKRLKDLPKVKSMIIKEMVDFLTWYYLLPLMPNYEKTGTRATAEQRAEMVRLKEMLTRHLPEIHKLAAQAGGDFKQDLESHFTLINKLRMMKAVELAEVSV